MRLSDIADKIISELNLTLMGLENGRLYEARKVAEEKVKAIELCELPGFFLPTSIPSTTADRISAVVNRVMDLIQWMVQCSHPVGEEL